MTRTLRAFAWLRWRMLVNSLERTTSRDTLQRFSFAIEKLGPIMAGVLMIPSGLAAAALGAGAGYALSQGEASSILVQAGRYVLLGMLVLSIVGPLLLPAGDRTNPTRMLLLPIPRTTMYVAQSSTALADAWILLAALLLAGVPIGLAGGGAVAAAAVALAAGGLLLLALVGITSLATTLLHLALRDRRRGELLTLLFIVVLPAVSLLPGLIEGRRAADREAGRVTSAARTAPSWVERGARTAVAAVPSELYIAAARSASSGRAAAGARPLLALAGAVALLHGFGFLAFRRVLESPGSTGARRASGGSWNPALLGVSPATSAVALTHLRLGIRTPRGRSTMLSPIIMLGVIAGVGLQSEGTRFGPLSFENGLGLACFASFVSLVAILPIAMNQFAIDRAGFTLAMLSPMSEREYLDGKAIGNALIVAPALLLSVLVPALLFGGGSIALWLSLVLSLAATYLVVSPAAATFSALFPRAVDLNSIGRGSNAHGLAGLLGMLAFAAAGAPCVLLVVAALKLLDRPSLAPLALLGWLAVALVLNRVLFAAARRLFSARRENLAVIAGQKTS